MKSVLHIGINAQGIYSSKGIEKGFKKAGFIDYDFLDYQSIRFNEGTEGLLQRMIVKANICKPDLIFIHIQNNDILDIETINQLSKIGFTVLYNFDCRNKDESKWMYDLTPYLGWVFFSNQEDVDNCNELGIKNVSVLQSSCDTDMYNTIGKKLDKYPDIVFVGNNYVGTNLNFDLSTQRQEMIDFMYFEFDNKFGSYGRGQLGQMIDPQEESLCYNSAKIAISQNNFDKELYTSDRIWKIMSCGTFCLARYFDGIETIFERGVHLDWFSSLDELKDKTEYYLKNDEERKSIAKVGMNFVKENHSWANRFEEMELIINKKLSYAKQVTV
jgi:spore maturation protein CgeB